MTTDSTQAPSGQQQLEAIRDGVAPPATIQNALRYDLVEVGAGEVVFSYTPSPEHCNPTGGVHGGIAMTLLDSAAGASVHSTLEPGRAYATLETKVNLVRAVRPDGGPRRAPRQQRRDVRGAARRRRGAALRARDLDLPDPWRLTLRAAQPAACAAQLW